MSRHRPTVHAAILLLSLCLTAISGCVTEPVISRHPVPSAERLQVADCALGAKEYGRCLAAPPKRPTLPATPEEVAQKIRSFQQDCESRLAGQVRRVVVHCWRDAPDTAALLACNDRF